MKRVERDWKEVQNFLDECGRIGLTLEKFSISRTAFNNAVRDGLIIRNLKPFHHSEETKENLSKIRSEFLKANPDKHPWKNNEKFKSKPCEFLKDFLRKNGISFIEEYNDFDKNYSIDIAFPKSKIALEVNGNQHYNNDGTLKEYYLIRDTYFKNLGWKTIQIPCHKVYSKDFQANIIEYLKNNIDVNFEYKPLERKHCKRCGKDLPKLYKSKLCKRCTMEVSTNVRNVERVFKIAEANIDFSKFGFIKKVSDVLELTPQHTSRWLKLYAPNLLNI